MTLFILIVGLVIATSFIAYWADNLGKKLGKKRISLLGMRPKQTATIISIISSVGIMLLTVGVLLATFSNLRNALLRYDKARRTAAALQEKNDTLAQDLAGLRAQRDSIQSQLTSLQKESLKAQAQRKAITAQLDQARERLGRLQKQLKDTERAERLAKAGEKNAHERAQAAQQRYAEVAAQLKAAQEKVASSQELLAKSSEQLSDTRASLKKTNHDFDEARSQLAKASDELAETQEHLATVNKHFELVDRQVKTTLDQYRNAAQNVEALRKRRDDLETQLELRQQELAELEFVAYQVATGDVEISRGTVFSRTIIPPQISPDLAKAQLQALLSTGEKTVRGRYVLILAPQQIYSGEQVQVLDAQQIIDYWAQRLSQSKFPISARLAAARDHARGEHSIATHFIMVPVRNIFEEGEVIESSTVDAESGDAPIFNQLLRLASKGETKARSQGSMPITTADSPFYAEDTNQRIFDALRKIQTFDGKVEVKMIADADISTIDLMRVRFSISPAKSKPAANL